MLIIRPIETKDLDDLMSLLSSESAHGLTSLPLDKEVLKRRLKHSENSFNQTDRYKPNGELYLFAMEDIFQGKIVGVSGIVSKIGGFEPFYFYRLEKQKKHSQMLSVDSEVTAMHVHKVYNGPAEICSLFLGSDFRNSQNGRFLSLSRFLYIANNMNLFEREIIAEMRGKVDENGHSPFWEAVGKKFFKIPFTQADYLTMKNKVFIEELLPNYPIIAELLPEEAQDVVGKVHPNTEPALHILKKEGFQVSDLVGIFEPGPVVHAKVEDLRCIKESTVAVVQEIHDDIPEDNLKIIANTKSDKFKTALGYTKFLDSQGVAINQVIATALKVKIGDQIRFVDLKKT